jgi:transposase
MFYLGIDQHRKQLTVALRDEQGNLVLGRQVSTNWKRTRDFLAAVREQCAGDGGFVAILEVCGFNDWLLKLLEEYGCREIVLIQAEDRARRKTDRRDASRLSELLWINRLRLLAGQPVHGLRRIAPPSSKDRENRQLTSLRKRLTDQRTRLINRIKRVINKHNLGEECPTKDIQAKQARTWLKQLALAELDRLEVDLSLKQWELLDEQLANVQKQISERAAQDENAVLIASLHGKTPGYAALTLSASIGSIDRFPKPRSLPNYWGLTPRCNNSGDAQQRLGKITRQGSPMARYMLTQLTTMVLRRDAWLRGWYKRIRQRRGVKVARVAVMRRLATIIWHMLKDKRPYTPGDPRKWKAAPKSVTGASA